MSQERGVAARRLRSAAPRLARGRSGAGRRRSRGRVGESSQPARPGPPLGSPPAGAEWEARLAALRGAGRHAEVPISSAFPGRGEAASAGRGPRSQIAPWELTGPRSACYPQPRCHVSAGLAAVVANQERFVAAALRALCCGGTALCVAAERRERRDLRVYGFRLTEV